MRALVIVGHGSHLNGDSSLPVYEHAGRIRETGEFDEVVECFWKEEPSMRHVLDTIESEDVYIVPAFISEGYFTQQVIPRELGLEGPVSTKGEKTVRYAGPLGTFEGMPDVILERTQELRRRHLPQRRTHQGAWDLRPRRGRVPGSRPRDRRRRRWSRGAERDPDPFVYRGGLAHARDDPRGPWPCGRGYGTRR